MVSEALANIAKYAQASRIEVLVERRDSLADRIAALDGVLTVQSTAGSGTTVGAELPLDEGG